MNFAIITHVPHIIEQNQYFAYAPYVKEMNIWCKYADKLLIVAPTSNAKKSPIDICYKHVDIDFVAIESFDILNPKAVLKTILCIPKVSWKIFLTMKKADHIHLRCPGNIGLIGSLLQILFPNKPKTAKYAGNWDLKSKQPFSYRLQKWILSSTFLTRNMQVLVYGEWEKSSKNIKPFFTATYNESDKSPIVPKDFKSQVCFVFVGALVSGKNPLYAIKMIEMLFKKGHNVTLELFGEGAERKNLELYIHQNNLNRIVLLRGNQTQEVVSQAFVNSHFTMLPSESEGWPKAIAEGMFWGCVPVATKVSCVPFMLDHGDRGVLLELNLVNDLQQLEFLLKDNMLYSMMCQKACDWSRQYTMNFFETEIKKLISR
jgi:glycosyltransferase involved in cell wall biosynthesis